MGAGKQSSDDLTGKTLTERKGGANRPTLKPQVPGDASATFRWSQNTDSSAFMTPEQYAQEDPPFPKKRKLRNPSFAASMKKRKLDSAAKEEQKPSSSSSGKTSKMKSDPDAPRTPKMDVDDDLQIMPAGNLRPKDKYVHLMDDFVPHVEIAFNELSTIRSTGIAYFTEFDQICDDNELSLRKFVLLFEKIMFVRHPEEVKEKWETPDGQRASELRLMVMRSCLLMARKNLFNDFQPRDPEDAENADLVVDEDGNPVLPIWLLMTDTAGKKKSRTNKCEVKKKDVRYSINAKSVSDAVSRNETRKKPKEEFNERKKIVLRGYPKRSEMAFYALNYLYHGLLKTFTKTRRTAKNIMFTTLGYLFMDWTTHEDCDVKDSDVHLRWAAPLGESVLDTWDADDIHCSTTYKDSSASLDNGNVHTFHGFARAADDVVLLVSHDVIVRDDKTERGKRRRVGSERRSWKKAVSLMEVIFRVLESLCGFTSAHPAYDLLRAHEYSVPLIYTLSRALRRVLSQLPGRVIEDGPAQRACGPRDDGNDDASGGRGEDGEGAPDEDKGGMNETGAGVGEESMAPVGDRRARTEDDVGTDGGEGGRDCAGDDGDRNGERGDANSPADDEVGGGAGLDNGPNTGTEAAGNGAGSTSELDGDVKADGNGTELGTGGNADLDIVIAEKFLALFMTDEIANSMTLKQVTCTIQDQEFWNEHIDESNETTARFAHIAIGGRRFGEDSGEESEERPDNEDERHDPESEPEDEEDFGF